jgi:S-formylglutathione hydrolase FrmB
MKKLFSNFFVFLLAFQSQAAKIETIFIPSKEMNKNVETVTIIPDNATKNNPCSVVYLLHGYGGNAGSWIHIRPELAELSDRYHLIFICPNGLNSWYLDSPVKKEYRYETFMSNELITYVDSIFPTKADRKARAITGLSMGGHGAMFLAMRHKEVFGAAGSTSGGVDIRPFPKNWDLSKLLGDEASNPSAWDAYAAINQIDRIQNGDLALIIDCGYSDFFFEVNNNFHKKLLERGIMHDYYTRPGGHTGSYWRNSIDYQILFFQKFFEGNNLVKN